MLKHDGTIYKYCSRDRITHNFFQFHLHKKLVLFNYCGQGLNWQELQFILPDVEASNQGMSLHRSSNLPQFFLCKPRKIQIFVLREKKDMNQVTYLK